MSKMKEVIAEIESLLEQGYRPMTIAGMLKIPVELVSEVAETAALVEVDNYSEQC
jgi:hypothetical protein